ncbi:MAG: ASCH domain-containing protein [Paludibacteraceae bacterium]|nr:ASCH domain-containing protein [Paludibacteraceae bacterium]
MKVLLSIKPEFADKIFEGKKQYEYRKVIFKEQQIKTVVVYASSPICRVIGEFEIDSIIEDTPKSLWNQTKNGSGISQQFFNTYFQGKSQAYAIRVKNARRYSKSMRLSDKYPGIVPPQSFCYVDRNVELVV